MGRLSRGEVWLVDLNPIRGHEQAGLRPALIVSEDEFNYGPSGLIVVVPISSREKGIPLHVETVPPEGGLRVRSFIMSEHVRSISKDRLTRRLGSIRAQTLAEVDGRLSILLGL